MKKSYIYFLLPIAALVVFFFAFYMGAHKDFEAREAAKVKAVVDAKEAKLVKEAKDREVAVKAAIEMQEKRRKEKAEKDAKDAADKEARELARAAREKALRDADKASNVVSRLKKEIEVEKAAIADVQKDKKRVIDEQGFLKEYVKKAEATTRNLQGVLERIEAADRAAEAAAKAAAEAAKAAKK